MSSTGREWEERQKALQAQKDIMARHYSALKQAMEHFRAQQNTRLKHLSANRYCMALGQLFSPFLLLGKLHAIWAGSVICLGKRCQA